ncbi:MAG: stage V sporulation protein M [Bacillota bacterium]
MKGGAFMRFYVIKIPRALRGIVRGIFGMMMKN